MMGAPRDRKDPSVIVPSVMIDHPSWQSTKAGISFRAVRCGDAIWALGCTPAGSDHHRIAAHHVSGAGEAPVVDVIDPAAVTDSTAMHTRLREAGTVARWRNPDLWDAMATSIVRQVIRAGQARRLYRTFCQAHGEPVDTPLGETYLFPRPVTVLGLPDAEFGRLGLAFNHRPLRAAAEAYLDLGRQWAQLEPPALVDEVQRVPRIGPWTAGVTVADLTNDYALYPFADLAVRTWAKLLAPERTWPDIEAEFARVWARLAGDRLSDWTLLTLAWGTRHASTTGATGL
jgi:DNA-3-methyladenine glycosylase II